MRPSTKSARALATLGALSLCLQASAAPDGPGAHQVVIKDFMFTPMTLTTQAGMSVTWINQDEEAHTVVSESGLFRSGALDTHEQYTFRFEKPGTYRVYCSFHSQMLATIIVE